jgi:hypothetical protein
MTTLSEDALSGGAEEIIRVALSKTELLATLFLAVEGHRDKDEYLSDSSDGVYMILDEIRAALGRALKKMDSEATP